jgi:hypothetical protein
MYLNTSQPRGPGVSVCVVSVALLWLALYCSPGLLLAQTTGSNAPGQAVAATAEEMESLPLTTAQEQARQLATALGKTQGVAPATAKRTPLEVVFDRAVRLGTRAVLPVFTAWGMEGRIVSGEQTLASPVEDGGTTEEEDARRTLFVPASTTSLAFEVLVE